MPSLHKVTAAELRACLTSAELRAVASCVAGEATDETAADTWLTEKISAACDRVVAAVNACPKNARIASGACKVPGVLRHTALVLARHAVISSIPGMADTLEGSSRAAEYAAALEELQGVATCALWVDDYAESGDEDVTGTGRCMGLRGKPANDFQGL